MVVLFSASVVWTESPCSFLSFMVVSFGGCMEILTKNRWINIANICNRIRVILPKFCNRIRVKPKI